MFVPERLLVGRSRMLRRAHRGLPNALKVRFSPTAIWTTPATPGDDEPASTTDEGLFPFLRPTTTSTPPATRTSSSSTSSTPRPTPTTPTTVAAPHTTSSTSVSTTSSSTTVLTTSSTSSSRSTTSASASATQTPTTTTPSSTPSTSSRTTALVTSTVSSHSSASSTATSSSGITTAGAIGIAAAAIVGFIAVISITVFLVRRWNRKKDEYDPDEFRRQSQVLRDDGSLLQRDDSGGHGGFAPRPPTMFERHHQNITTFAMPPPPPNAYQSNSYGPANLFGDYASQQHSPFYTRGPDASPAPSAQYANVSSYNMQSSTGFPVSMGPYDGAAYITQDMLVRTPSNAATSVLSRNNSAVQPPYPTEEVDYADLTRSSVTPFQAAQYEAISKQLNIPPPQPLQQVSEADEMDEPNQIKEEKPAVMVSPFEEPQAGGSQNTPPNDATVVDEAARASSEIHATPEPASRIPSSPPSLPEIKMMSGTFSPVALSFPATPSPRKGSFDLHSGRASPKVDLPPLNPVFTSPQRAQFVDGNEARAHDGRETPVEIGFVGSGASKANAVPSSAAKVEVPEHEDEPSKTAATNADASKSETSKRPDTVYSDDDAYGGF